MYAEIVFLQKKRMSQYQQQHQQKGHEQKRPKPQYRPVSLAGFRPSKGRCSFCGAPMDWDDMFCGECGGNTAGITCPWCGTLSYRSFCPGCNAALDELAAAEVEKAQKDPKFLQIQQLAARVADIEAKIKAEYLAVNGEAPEAIAEFEDVDLDSETRQLLDSYASLASSLQLDIATPPAEEEPKSESVRIELQVHRQNLSDATAEYKKMVRELNDLMSSLVPPADATPEMQRNYYCARKVAVIREKKVKVRTVWECNICHCLHRQPSECVDPDLGGTWHYVEKTTKELVYE